MRSDTIKKGFERAPHRGLLHACGLSDEEMGKIIDRMNDRLQGEVRLRIQVSCRLEKTFRGKTKRVVLAIEDEMPEGADH